MSARGIRGMVKLAVIGLTLTAISKEMAKPEAERTWTGRVAGVPYDFRPPTWDRLREAYWNPEEESILTDRPFGLGWAVNFGRLWLLASELMDGMGAREGVKEPFARWSASGMRRTAVTLHETADSLRESVRASTNGNP